MRILAAVVLTLCALSAPALADDEVWVCRFLPESDNRAYPARYWLHEGHFAAVGMPPIIYTVQVDTDLAIIAVYTVALDKEYIAPTPSHPDPVIGSETIAINRKTGDAVEGGVALYDYGQSNPPLHGTCHRQTSHDPDAVWPRDFQGKKD